MLMEFGQEVPLTRSKSRFMQVCGEQTCADLSLSNEVLCCLPQCRCGVFQKFDIRADVFLYEIGQFQFFSKLSIRPNIFN